MPYFYMKHEQLQSVLQTLIKDNKTIAVFEFFIFQCATSNKQKQFCTYCDKIVVAITKNGISTIEICPNQVCKTERFKLYTLHEKGKQLKNIKEQIGNCEAETK